MSLLNHLPQTANYVLQFIVFQAYGSTPFFHSYGKAGKIIKESVLKNEFLHPGSFLKKLKMQVAAQSTRGGKKEKIAGHSPLFLF